MAAAGRMTAWVAEPLIKPPTARPKIAGVHVGGKSALDWYGVRHQLSQQPILHLYGWTAAHLPYSFTDRFPAGYHRKRLFDEQPGALFHVGPFEKRSGAPQVSEPERALLEVLSEVGVRQPPQKARQLLESTYCLRADVLRNCDQPVCPQHAAAVGRSRSGLSRPQPAAQQGASTHQRGDSAIR
jgi:hypothetical protein